MESSDTSQQPPTRVIITTNTSRVSSRGSSRRPSLSSTGSSGQWVNYLPSDAADPQLCQISWVGFRRIIFPIEIFFFGFIFSVLYFSNLCQLYYFQRLANDKLNSLHSHSNDSICINQDYYVNHTSRSSFLHLQQKVNDLNMYSNIVFIVISTMITIFLGPLSDVVGRKPMIIYGVIGTLCISIIQLVIVYWKLDVHYYLIAFVFYGASGGFGFVLGLVGAVVVDTTPKRWLTVRMGFVELSIAFGRILSSVAANNWIQSTNCVFLLPALLMVSVSIVTLIYALLIPESLQRESTNNRNISKQLCKTFNGLKIFLNPNYLGVQKWWRLCVASIILSIGVVNVVGNSEIINYFLHNRPLEWSYNTIGIYGAVAASSMGVALLVVLPVLVLLKLSDLVVCLVGALSAVVTNIIIANVQTSWEMYVAGIVNGLTVFTSPTIRSILSELVSPEDQGAVLTMSSAFQTFFSIIATVIVNQTYRPETTIDGHQVNAGIAFWIMAAICSLSVPLVLLLMFCKKKRTMYNIMESNKIETRGLLGDESDTSYNSILTLSDNDQMGTQ